MCSHPARRRRRDHGARRRVPVDAARLGSPHKCDRDGGVSSRTGNPPTFSTTNPGRRRWRGPNGAVSARSRRAFEQAGRSDKPPGAPDKTDKDRKSAPDKTDKNRKRWLAPFCERCQPPLSKRQVAAADEHRLSAHSNARNCLSAGVDRDVNAARPPHRHPLQAHDVLRAG